MCDSVDGADSLATAKSVAAPEDDQGGDAGAPGDERIDRRDDGRPPRHVREAEQSERDDQHHAGEHEDDGERGPAGTDSFEQAQTELVRRTGVRRLVTHPLQPFGETRVVVSGHRSGSQCDPGDEKYRGGDGAVHAEQVVEYCANNVDEDDRQRIESLGCETRGFACLERCGTCRRTPFLVVGGTVRRGQSHEALVADVTGCGANLGEPTGRDSGGDSR